MSPFTPAGIEAQRRRWTGCTAHLWWRADAARFGVGALAPKPPPRKRATTDIEATRRALAAEIEELRALKQVVAEIQLDFTCLGFPRSAALARKYNPDQPRVPAGNPDSGQWSVG
jgi:hypothetical protein